MEQKVVQKKKAEEGNAKFDENHKMMIPYKEGNKTTMKTQDEMQKILDKQKVAEKSNTKSKQKVKVKQSKVADDSFRQKFTSCVLAKVDGVEKAESGDKIVLKFGSNALCRLMNRAGHRFTVYRKAEDGSRDTIKIATDEDELKLLQWIKTRVEFLKAKVPKPKVKKAKVPKSNKNAKQPKTVEEKLNKAEEKAIAGHGNGFSLKTNKIKITPQVTEWVESKGYKLETTSVKF